MLKYLLAMTFLSLNAKAIQPRDKVDLSELPDAICKVRFANMAGVSTRHCNATFVSPTQLLIPQSCYTLNGGGFRGAQAKVSCRKGPQREYENAPRLTVESAKSHPAFTDGNSKQRPTFDMKVLTVSPAVTFPVMEPVLDPVQVEEILKQAQDDQCFLAGYGGHGGHYNRRTIPRSERLLVRKPVGGDEIRVTNAFELNDEGSAFYCQVNGKLWLLGMMTWADRGIIYFVKDKVNYIPTLTPAAEWLRTNLN